MDANVPVMGFLDGVVESLDGAGGLTVRFEGKGEDNAIADLRRMQPDFSDETWTRFKDDRQLLLKMWMGKRAEELAGPERAAERKEQFEAVEAMLALEDGLSVKDATMRYRAMRKKVLDEGR